MYLIPTRLSHRRIAGGWLRSALLCALLLSCGHDPSPGPIIDAPATQLAITTQPNGAASGVDLTTQPVVQVRDAGNTVVAGSAVAVTAAITSGTGTLTGTTTVNAVAGVATFTNLQIVGGAGVAHGLTFTAPGLTAAVSNSFTVSSLPATQLAITTQPSGAVSGVNLTTQPVAELRDARNAPVTGGSTVAVTAAIASGSGTLLGTTTVNAVGGVATFTNLRVNGVGAHTLTFTSAGLTAAVSTSFTATQSVASLSIQTQPGGATTGSAFTTQPLVRILDDAGLLITTATIAVTATRTTGTGTLLGTTTVNAAVGVATFTNLRIDGLGPHGLTFSTAVPIPPVISATFVVGATTFTPPFSFSKDVVVTSPGHPDTLRVLDAADFSVTPAHLSFVVTQYIPSTPDSRLTVSPEGVASQQGVLGDYSQRAYRVRASVDGQTVPGMVLAVPHDADASRTVFQSSHWRLIVPSDWVTQAIQHVPELATALDHGWEVERGLVGSMPQEWREAQTPGTGFGPHALFENPDACGVSSIPLGFSRTCFFDGPTGYPQWHFIFHELGHTATIDQSNRMMFGSIFNGARNFVEGEANLFGLYVLNALSQDAALTVSTRANIKGGSAFSFDKNSAGFLANLAAWEASSAPYDGQALGAEFVWNGIEVRFASEFGWSYVPRYARAWRRDQSILSMLGIANGGTPTATAQATFAAAALSAAVRQDLRSRFITWRYPIDDALFTQVFTRLSATIDTPW